MRLAHRSGQASGPERLGPPIKRAVRRYEKLGRDPFWLALPMRASSCTRGGPEDLREGKIAPTV